MEALRFAGVCFMGALLSVLIPLTGFAADKNEPDPGSGPVHLLKSGSELDYPPFCIITGNREADGFSVELLQAVARAARFDVSFEVGPWEQIKQKLIQGEMDVLPFVSYSRERDRVLDFTAPYLRLHGTVFVRKGETSIHGEADLKDREVLVMRGDTAHEYALQKNITDHLILTDSFEQAFKLLSSGRHDAVIMQQLAGIQLIRQLNISNVMDVDSFTHVDLKITDRPLESFEQKFCIAVKEGDKELLASLNEGLALVIANGVFDGLYHKWFGPILPKPSLGPAGTLKMFVLIFLPILFVLGIFGIWFLNREVARKTERLTAQIKISEATKADLLESKTHLRTLIDTLPDLVWLKDPKGVYLSCNPRFEDFFGAREKDIVGRTDYDFVDRELADFFRENDRKAISEGRPGINEEKIVFADDGHSEILETIKTPIYQNGGELMGVLGIGRDITRRKEAEEVIRHERDQFDRIMETSPAGIIRFDKKGKIIYANRRAEKILGIRVSENEPVGYDNPIWKITDFYGNPVPVENLLFNVVRKTGGPIFDIRHAIEWPDGRQAFLSINATPLLEDSGRFDGMVASVDDITEKYRAEQNYKLLFTEMLDGFAIHEIVCDDSGHPVDYRFLDVNPAFERLTGLNKDFLIGKTVLEALPHTEPIWIEKYGQVALSGKPDSFESYSKELGRHFRVSAFRYARNQFACIFVDLTGQKALEKRINQAQKMESIGNLAGGIAHDFNNLLFPIIGMSELLMEDLSPDSMEYQNVREIYTAGKRGSQLVRQILAFSRQTETRMIPVRIQQILKEVLKLTRSTIPADIVIEADIQKDCGLVMADPAQIHQIAMNLITNAYHAVEEAGGRIKVQLMEIDPGDDQFLETSLEKGRYARLSVSDTGCGIDPQIINKIFEPYFTTKVQGKGTGLGLAVVYGIVKENNGEIKVRSTMGKGATFDVYLPLMNESTVLIPRGTAEIFKAGTERILLVDDETPILKLEKQMLEKLGYTVTIQTGSVEALDLLSINPHAFDLVITDMSMPVMTGMDMAKQIIKLRPDIPIILCTGFSERISEPSMAEAGIKHLLMKPVVKYEMAKAIRDTLDR